MIRFGTERKEEFRHRLHTATSIVTIRPVEPEGNLCEAHAIENYGMTGSSDVLTVEFSSRCIQH